MFGDSPSDYGEPYKKYTTVVGLGDCDQLLQVGEVKQEEESADKSDIPEERRKEIHQFLEKLVAGKSDQEAVLTLKEILVDYFLCRKDFTLESRQAVLDEIAKDYGIEPALLGGVTRVSTTTKGKWSASITSYKT